MGKRGHRAVGSTRRPAVAPPAAEAAPAAPAPAPNLACHWVRFTVYNIGLAAAIQVYKAYSQLPPRGWLLLEAREAPSTAAPGAGACF